MKLYSKLADIPMIVFSVDILLDHLPEIHSTPALAAQLLGLGRIHPRREGRCNCSSEDGTAADECLGI